MTEDQGLAVLLRTCGAGPRIGSSGRARVLDLLEAVDALAPGLVQQAASRIQLKRLPRAPAH